MKQEIRNIAIIAHVDHGKTTLTDALLRQTKMTQEGTTLDSNALEQERGITIYSKNCSLFYRETKINIVDTPGHADFGSEVERVLRAIDDVVLVVDAQEGPMPQTKFVLKKSLELGLKPMVVINKIDKAAARPDAVHEDVLELFMDLGANDAQLDFTTIYADARSGIAKRALTDESTDLTPLLDAILEHVPPAAADVQASFRMQPFNLAYDNYLGRMAIGRVYSGTVRTGDAVFVRKEGAETQSGKITKIFSFHGVERREAVEATAGDIVMIAGLPDIFIGETICASASDEPLPAITVDEPTISLHFLVNNTPFAGTEGTFVTGRQIRERLERELEVNVGLRVDFSPTEHMVVSGRGELHIAILLEQMRREGYELQVSQPQVILKDVDGVPHEPFEEVIVEVPESFMGTVIDKLSRRKGQLLDVKPVHGYTRLTFEIPTRGFLGYRSEFIMDTHGEGILYSRVIGFRPHVGPIEKHIDGSMISGQTGTALSYSLGNLQDRGMLYIGHGEKLYEGQVIGSAAKGMDMTVNPTKGKNLTNMRSKGEDAAILLTPPVRLTLERGLEIMREDEYLEVTPKGIRLRKKLLTEIGRVRLRRTGSS